MLSRHYLLQIRALHKLARLYGVQTSYYDVTDRRRQASVEALLAVLQALGAPVATLRDVPAALRERQQERQKRILEPVTVVWEGTPASIGVCLPSAIADAPLAGHLTLETGERQSWKWQGADLPALDVTAGEGARYVVRELPLPERLPWGYHRFALEMPGGTAETLVIAAPLKAYIPRGKHPGQRWGVFLPLYALHTEGGWGSGVLSDLEALASWVVEMGGGVVATLPLLATFLDELFEPSPYVPVSRLLWNEAFLDVTGIPELQKCPSAQALLSSPSFQKDIEALRSLPLVDYRRLMAMKRRVLMELSRACFAESPDRLEALRRFVVAHPVVEDYARFRSVGERQRISWRLWPEPLRSGAISEGDYDAESKRYHLYVQWLACQQIEVLSEKARAADVTLHLDLPLGVHPDGYDVWRHRDLFVQDISTGAPPDAFFSLGQNWAFPPLHPEKLRQQGYSYYIDCLRHHLKYAGILRIDHMMSLHRLFWIPKGMKASQGVYVRYHPEEFHAILTLESQRSKAIIAGEDLGTVPPQVRPAMARHGLHRTFVVQCELAPDTRRALRGVSWGAVASLDTHDMPPFAAFWQGLDIQQRLRLGLLDEVSSLHEVEYRQALRRSVVNFLRREGKLKGTATEVQDVLRACLAFLGASRARVVLVNLEDLWLETQPQNMPGTQEENPNWRRKSRYTMEVFTRLPQVVEPLRELDQARRQGRSVS